MWCPKRKRRRVKRREKRRKNTRRRADIQTAAGLTLNPFSPVTSRGNKRQKGMDAHLYITYTLNLIHKTQAYFSSVCLVGVCLFLYPCSPPPAPLASRFSWLDDLQSPTEQPFCVDRKADAANWTYKSLYRGDVAR